MTGSEDPVTLQTSANHAPLGSTSPGVKSPKSVPLSSPLADAGCTSSMRKEINKLVNRHHRNLH